MLLHEKRCSEEETAGQQQMHFIRIHGPPKAPGSRNTEEGHEMRRMCGRAQDRRADGQQRVRRGGNATGQRTEQFLGEKENQYHGSQVHCQQAQVDAGRGLSEDRHEGGVSHIDSRQFLMASQLVRGDTLQQQLTHIGHAAFIALQGELT